MCLKISLLIFRTKSFGAVSTPPGAGILAHRHVIVAENTKSSPKNNRKHTLWDVLSAIHLKVYLIKINFSRIIINSYDSFKKVIIIKFINKRIIIKNFFFFIIFTFLNIILEDHDIFILVISLYRILYLPFNVISVIHPPCVRAPAAFCRNNL